MFKTGVILFAVSLAVMGLLLQPVVSTPGVDPVSEHADCHQHHEGHQEGADQESNPNHACHCSCHAPFVAFICMTAAFFEFSSVNPFGYTISNDRLPEGLSVPIDIPPQLV